VSRRVRTLTVSGVLFVVLFVLALTIHVPYVVLSPGPTYNTLATDENGNTIIVIHGVTPRHTTGNLNMTTVGISTRPVTVFTALRGWLRHDEVVVPRSSVYEPGKSDDQVQQQDAADFAQSQDDAIAAAACELGYPAKFGVVTIEARSPSLNKLRPTDVLVSVDGTAVSSINQLTGVLEKDKPGQVVAVNVVRAGKPLTVSIPLAAPLPNKKGARLGIGVGSICATPFTVDLGLGNQIGGPSAGLMFALGIIDKVGTVDLTNGAFIAGTGTIDETGKVGPIGGIQLKMIAARRAHATIFLAPAGNCSDVRGAIPDGLKVVKVSTLHDAVQDLLAIEQGRPVPSC